MARGARRRIVEPNLNTSLKSRSSTKRRGSSPGRSIKGSVDSAEDRPADKLQSSAASGSAQDSGHGSLITDADISASLIGTPSKPAGNIVHSTPVKLQNRNQPGSTDITDTPDHLYGLDVDTDTDKEENNTTKDVAVGHEPRSFMMTVVDGIRYVAAKVASRVKSVSKSFWIALLVGCIIFSAVLLCALLYNRTEQSTCPADSNEQGRGPQIEPELINELKAQIKELSSLVSGMSEGIADSTAKRDNVLSKQELTQTLEEYMEAYAADKVGLPDYALEASGGRIHKPHVSPTNTNGAAKVSMFGVPVFIDAKDPSVILQPDNTPGNCWPMRGQRGYVVIKLAQSVIPMSFTLEHIPKALSLTGDDTIPSAPKDFSVFGWHDPEGENKTMLGRYTYDSEKKPLQTFAIDLPLEKNTEPFLYVELNVQNNYGEPHYTCIYRFRVHGQPSTVPRMPANDDDEVDVRVTEEKQ